MPRGRPLLLATLDEIVQRFLIVTHNKSGLISRTIAIAAAKRLIARNPQNNLGHIYLESSFWAKSLFHRMGLMKRIPTTGKTEIHSTGKKKLSDLLRTKLLRL